MSQSEEQPLVSVCIQTYQHAAYIKECLDSVLIQETDFPFEIILGEDDSTDGTRRICIEYANRYPDIIRLFLRAEKDKIFINGEKTGRFNFIGNLKAASGKYIALLDGDDYWLTKHKLQKQVDFMRANTDCSMSFHKTLHSWKKGKPFIKNKELPDSDTKFCIEVLLKPNTIHTSNCMFLRSNIDEMPQWFYEVPVLDFPLHIHNAQKGKIGFIAEAMSVYRIHPGGMCSSRREPINYIRIWHLYSIMAANLNGEVGSMIISRRFKIGTDLINFYKNHLWEKRGWFKKELGKRKFSDDEILLQQFCLPPTLKNYLFNCCSYSKKIVRRVIKGS